MVIRKNDLTPIDFGGLEISDYTAGLNEKSSFAIVKVKPNVEHQLSWSKRSDKFYYVIKGKIEFFLADEEFVLNEGDFCLVEKGEKFKYKNGGNETATLVLAHTPNFVLDEEVFE